MNQIITFCYLHSPLRSERKICRISHAIRINASELFINEDLNEHDAVAKTAQMVLLNGRSLVAASYTGENGRLQKQNSPVKGLFCLYIDS